MIIKFNNWNKYQPRKDYKRNWWFAMSNDFPISPKFFDFDNEERLIFVYLLCETSRQGKDGKCVVISDHFSRLWNVKKSVIEKTIRKLIDKEICTSSVQNPFATEQYITEQNRTEQNTIAHFEKNDSAVAIAPEFDFEILYKKYPRKVGKAEGIKRLRSMILTDQDYQDCLKAIDLYIGYLKNHGTETQYIKYFTTFLGTKNHQVWRDWLDPQAGHGEQMKKELSWKFLEDENDEERI